MPQPSNNADPRVIAYKKLRKAIGVLGTALPFVLAAGGLILFSTGIQSSLSAYYHTDIGDVFVGTLCAIGVFFYAYRGYTGELGNDDQVGNLAGIFAIGVALFPTDKTYVPTTPIGIAHVVFAALFLLTLAYFSLFLFTKTDQDDPHPPKLRRNTVYRVAGYVIIASLVLIGVLALLPEATQQALSPWKLVFLFESAAVVAFGISWLTKGQMILRDED